MNFMQEGIFRFLMALLIMGMLTGCGVREQTPADHAEVITRVASEIYAALPKDRPGFGATDYPGNQEKDVPKAYAMVLLAELDRMGHSWRAGDSNLARNAGEWLLANADLNRDSVIGWGVPVAWDAYGDGSTNPADTEYTISTAIVIDALLTWLERDPRSPHAAIKDLVARAISPYLERNIWSPSGMAPYSLAAADRRYDTFNPAAYMAGQIQRASVFVSDHDTRVRYADAADATMKVLLQHRKHTPGAGSWYWNYSITEGVPNDLPHAGYIVAGIRSYLEHGGRLADQFDWYAVLSHLGDFRGASGEVLAWPVFRRDVQLPARSYDLGFALHISCSESRTAHLVPWLTGALQLYRLGNGRYLKYPKGTKGMPELVVNEYETYLYRGLASCAVQDRPARPRSALSPVKLTGADEFARKAIDLAAAAPGVNRVVPLLPASAGIVSFDAAQRARITLPSGVELRISSPGVPVRVLTEGHSTVIFHRRYPDNVLTILRYNGQALVCGSVLSHLGSSVPMLRAAAFHSGNLHVVYYHNPTQANWYKAWELKDGCPVEIHRPTKLPSLGDPAGATYEMIPSVRFIDAGGRLHLVGGNVQLEVQTDGLASARLIEGCRHVVESVATPSGLAHLCIASTLDGTTLARPLRVLVPNGISAPAIDFKLGVPWRLRWSMGALQIDHAGTSRQLRHMLRRDIAQTDPGGWMEFGINNEEGRVPWSQLYYLNGLLDILDLAHRDRSMLELFGPMLHEVRLRLDQEMLLLDEQILKGNHKTRAFTVDRSSTLFAVQTGRILLTMHRYLNEVSGPTVMRSFPALRRAVNTLEGHIDVVSTAGQDAKWIQPGKAYLAWPLGSAFYFDGMPVPFNHQNEWAYAVLATAQPEAAGNAVKASIDILRHFINRVAIGGELPRSGEWDYWWGWAYDGWSARDRRSVNKPHYAGDHGKAWISFRTIDSMALVASAAYLQPNEAARSNASLADLVGRGLVYPFANQVLLKHAPEIHLAPAVAIEYARVSAPWELGSAVWAVAAVAADAR